MIIGVDFDNTIVCYDTLFHRVARERGLVPASVVVNKNAVRDYLRAAGREPEWTALQGYVYGARMVEAEPFPGVHAFFRTCREQGIKVHIISHKTRHPFVGEPYDLHAAARDWLRRQGFMSPEGAGLSEERICFALTKAEKLTRITECACTHFIDDLPEILSDPAFPARTARLLFAPTPPITRPAGAGVFASWADLQSHLVEAKPPGQSSDLRPADLASLLAPLHRALPHTLSPVSGGANNRVHRAQFSVGDDLLVKHYFAPVNDTRDRFGSERAFFQFAWEIAHVRCIPRPLAWDESARLGVFEFVAGSRVGQTTESDVNAALAFFAEINSVRDRATMLPTAAEACFTLADHLATVQRRMDRLSELAGPDPVDADALRFVREVLVPSWQTACATPALQAAVRAESAASTPPQPRCISPSDFGFHNALRRPDGSLVFFDFEYSGWDDPAKLVCDFFCQPAVPAPAECHDGFVARVASVLGYDSPEVLAERARLLLPVYRLKWCAIMLNEFLPTGNDRRRFAGTADITARKVRQLAKATAALQPSLALAS